MKFTYRWGQRPLEGYTLKRGLGQGGFGEVYFGVSDGGKEVALKLIRGHSDTELRGIANCLNLKHPNLVHLYDLRLDGQGDRWLVMEYIQGVPLSTILERNPRGLPEGQARRWFLQTARAVAFLHDHAVVHRDIKPANVFVENGLAKLGDYGLSKAVGTSQHAQSSNVGTIHYMAPEVASGNYSKQIDVYACGVLLYEMLTGQVPFKGDSWAEIAIKHQTDRPDMRRVPALYVPILEKALSKKAEKRFANMDAMIDAFEAAGRPEREAPRPPREPDRPTKPDRDAPAPATPTPPAATSWRIKASELSTACLVTPLFAIPITAIWALFTGSVQWHVLGSLFLTMTAVAWSVLWTTKIWEGRSTSTARRIALGLCGVVIGCGAFWLEGWSFPQPWLKDEALPPGAESLWGGLLCGEMGSLKVLYAFALYFSLALVVPRWRLAAERRRTDRFSLYPLFATGFMGLILLLFWNVIVLRPHDSAAGYLVLALAGAATIVQLVSPHAPPPPRNPRFRRRLYEPARY